MKKVPLVSELRRQGWKVRVGHFRVYYKYLPHNGKREEYHLLKSQAKDRPDLFLDPKGGTTEVTIKAPNQETDFFGVSRCYSTEHYVKDMGIKKALARAISLQNKFQPQIS